MGTDEIRAARKVPSDVTPSASATMRTVESATSTMETYSHMREEGRRLTLSGLRRAAKELRCSCPGLLGRAGGREGIATAPCSSRWRYLRTIS